MMPQTGSIHGQFAEHLDWVGVSGKYCMNLCVFGWIFRLARMFQDPIGPAKLNLQRGHNSNREWRQTSALSLSVEEGGCRCSVM